jgi:hypothetical protein
VDRSAGTGLAGFGAALAIAGAILRYAVTVNNTQNFNLHDMGMILLIAGIVLFALGLLVLLFGGWRRTVIRHDVEATPAGQVRVERRSDML